MKYTIAIADDHLLIAKAISKIIEDFYEFEVLYEAENGMVLLERLQAGKQIPDIILLDISMPVMDGFDTAVRIRAQFPGVLIMALSVQGDDESLIKMIRSGANGYLHKNVHPEELEFALKTLVKKGMYYPEWVTNRIFSRLAQPEEKDDTGGVTLSEREREFLTYVTTEMSYKEIAEKMFCSPRTVEGYRDSLFEKLGMKTRVGLAVYAIRNKLQTK